MRKILSPSTTGAAPRLAAGAKGGLMARGGATVAASMVALALGPSVILLMSFGIFLPALHQEFGWSVASISLGASIISLMIMLVSPVQGYLADRIGARALVLASLPAFGAGLTLMYFLPSSIGMFYLACVLLPVLGLGLWPLSYMKAVTTWFDGHLGLALGITNVGLGIGSTLLPFLLGAVFLHFGWRVAYVLLGLAVVLLVWPVAALWLRESGRGVARPGAAPPAAAGLTFREAAATRAFAVMAGNFAILGAISTGMLVHQVNILGEAGIGVGYAIYVQSAVGIGSIVGRVGTGWLLDRMSASKVGAGIFLVAALACLALASPMAATLGILAAASVGFVIGAEFDLLGVLIRRYQGLLSFGRIYGMVFSSFQLGGALGAAGLAWSRSALHSYHPALLALCGLSLVGGALFALMGPYRFGAPQASRGLPDAGPPILAAD